ncbi:MAG: TlpA disulfide reductase family protein [Bradyrhizobium sp.]|jgi:cytochrome c biogenesis protein CcmG/thiol:disulfide interchange protein DsbE|uniref:TlpA family protein disulfide reductase n=1 Tax=Bradyrhizobium denitrificans TaxID=2734912 RepID=A0ABS5GH91_9BRAD|nr:MULTISPECIES: TlpA disulfide reductase family protein [Bradyrhizobium]RTL91203.1 MAG: TlpA family protein disulfide reductase [Bradyrhizobiaceae bacterium]ABQ33637.1 putative thioredoxin related protein [Bradyrhizobium sp. BTAi1]MBR1140705.1 TlpA family protein disulfide reductase [Bradyrhizobium denitrificans]MCL8488048.1 TlpA family protein disulfide reductase [Bradyrhizobium denitrificans]MDH6264554.1 cytochrome c biogenesis protein CcmG/thiol:disulfide interchange protein DsbE [Bradyrhi
MPIRARSRRTVPLVAGIIAVAMWGAASAAPAIDEAAPPLIVSALGGETLDLGKMRGKVVLVNYWATWCAPCRRELPVLNAFYRRYHERGLELIGISADRPEDFGKMRKISGTLAYPTSTLERISQDGFGPPEGFPLTFVIDRDGVVRDKFIDVREQLLRDVVLPLLPH